MSRLFIEQEFMTRMPLTSRQRACERLATRNEFGLRDSRGLGPIGRNPDGLMSELPDRADSAQDDEAINEGLEQVAFFFFRLHQQRVGRLGFVGWVV